MSGPIEGDLVTYAREYLLLRARTARRRIWLASPYLSFPVAAALCQAAEQRPGRDLRLLTALEPRAVESGFLSAKGLAGLRASGFKIASRQNLHAKLSLIDGWGLVGSGNLTVSGLGGEDDGNVELGVVLDTAQVQRASALFSQWWARSALVGPKRLEEYQGLPVRGRAKGRPKPVGPPVRVPRGGGLLEILEEDPVSARSRRYWINSNHHNPDDELWWKRGWVSDHSRRPYAVGDLLVVYLGKENGGPQRCPAVLRVTALPEEKGWWVAEQRDEKAAERWPWVTMTSTVYGVSPLLGAPLSAAEKHYLQVENGAPLTRREFEGVAEALLAA